MADNNKKRIAVGLLALSASGFALWQSHEGLELNAMIPTKGDVPTIGHGSTRYEDGSKVKMGDKITPARAAVLAKNLMRKDEQLFASSMPGSFLHPAEFDVYMDYVGQYGMGNWRTSSMRREVMAGNYAAACHALLRYRFAAGYDCSTIINGAPNERCYGSWKRQLKRHAACMGAQ